MSKVVKGVIGIAATVVGVVTGNFKLAAQGALLFGSALIKKKSGKPRAAAAESLQLGEVPRQAGFGRVATSGSLVDGFNYGGKYGTDWELLVIDLFDHRCDALEGFYVNDSYVAFGGDGDVAGYSGQLKVWFRNGTETQAIPSVVTTNGPGWTPADNGAGICYVVVAYKADAQDAKNPVWTAGRPRFTWIVRGALCYDPRKDSSVGGVGPHRWNNPATREWSENLIVCRHNHVRGIFACDRVAQPEQLMIGRGLSETEAPPANVFARANLCDETVDGEPRYRVGGTVTSTDTFGDVDSDFAMACAGVISQPEGAVEVDPGQAKAAVVTITDADLIVGGKVRLKRKFAVADKDWVNTVVASYIEPSHKWQPHDAPVRREIADVIADKMPREERLQLGFVTWIKQAGRVAEIHRRLGRLPIAAEIVLPPRFCDLEEGDWIVWQSARYFGGLAYTFRIEAWGQDVKRHMSLQLRQISASCFTPGAPLTSGSVAVNQPSRPAIGTPSGAAWSLAAGHIDAGSVRSPALIVTGLTDDPSANFVRLEYYQGAAPPTGSTIWSDAGVTGPDIKRREIPVAAGGVYRVGLSYVVDGIPGDRLILGPVTAPSLTYPDGTPIQNLQPDEAGANKTYVDGAGALQGVDAGAGTVVDNSRVPFGHNLIPNSDQRFVQTFKLRWNPDNFNMPLGSDPQHVHDFIYGWTVANYVLPGNVKSALVYQSGRVASPTYGFVDFDVFGADGTRFVTPCNPGERMFASVYVQNHRCPARLYLTFEDATGQFTGFGTFDLATPTNTFANQLGGGGMVRIAGSAIAPAGTRSASILVAKGNTIAGEADSYCWIAAPMLERASANQQAPSPYQSGPINHIYQTPYTGDLAATLGAAWGSNLTGRPANLVGLAGTEGIQNAQITAAEANTANLLRRVTGGLYTGDLAATEGAAWGSNLTGRPANLVGLAGTEGIQNAQITAAEANTANLLRRVTGGLYTGDLAATLGAAWGSNLTGRPAELTDGRVAAGIASNGDVARDLPTTLGIRQSSSVVRNIARGSRIEFLRDGVPFTFPTAWGSGQLPQVRAFATGYQDPSNYLDCYALDLTSTGFTPVCKRVGPGTLTAQNEGTAGTASGPRVREIVKQLATEAHNDLYSCQFDVTVTNSFYAPDSVWLEGSAIIGVWTWDGATWQMNATVQVNGISEPTSTTVTNIIVDVARDGMGANDRFGLSIESSQYGASIPSFDTVAYYTTSGNTISSATPTGYPGIPFLIQGGAEN